MLMKTSSAFILLVILHTAFGNSRFRRQSDEPSPGGISIVFQEVTEEPTTTTEGKTDEEKFVEVTEALRLAIVNKKWPKITRTEAGGSSFGLELDNLEIKPFYMRSAEFTNDLAIRIKGAYGSARANYVVSKEINLLFWSWTVESQGDVQVDFSAVDMTARLNAKNDDEIELLGCESNIGENIKIEVSGGDGDFWNDLTHTAINTLSWLFDSWVTDIVNNQLCDAFETVLEEYPQEILDLIESVANNA